jgi:hypothetical protein
MPEPTLTIVWCRQCGGVVVATTAPFQPAYVERWVAAVFLGDTMVQAYQLADGASRVHDEPWCRCGVLPEGRPA